MHVHGGEAVGNEWYGSMWWDVLTVPATASKSLERPVVLSGSVSFPLIEHSPYNWKVEQDLGKVYQRE